MFSWEPILDIQITIYFVVMLEPEKSGFLVRWRRPKASLAGVNFEITFHCGRRKKPEWPVSDTSVQWLLMGRKEGRPAAALAPCSSGVLLAPLSCAIKSLIRPKPELRFNGLLTLPVGDLPRENDLIKILLLLRRNKSENLCCVRGNLKALRNVILCPPAITTIVSACSSKRSVALPFSTVTTLSH